MAYITPKIINGHKYYYARISKRVNGKPKIVQTIYLGTVGLSGIKGNNSQDNLKSFKATEMHFVGSLKLNQCQELLKVPLRKYRELKGPGLQELKAYRTQQKVFAEQRTILGKTILFTDNHKWTDEQIVVAYRAQYKIEHAFREMKNPHFLGWNPRFHWTKQKIRVHAFYCVAALTLVSLLRRELAAKGLPISAEKLMRQLNGIRETASVYPQGKGQPPKLSYSISRLNETQKKLYDLLALSRFRQS